MHPNKTPCDVVINNLPPGNVKVIGAKTGVSYGMLSNGAKFRMWKSDAVARTDIITITKCYE